MRDSSPGADDCFHPPPIPIEVFCLHCRECYDSYLIHWVEDAGFGNGGYWSCPTPDCDGKGFCFDIWPTDPEWRDENGEKVWFDDLDEDEDDEEWDGEEEWSAEGEWGEDEEEWEEDEEEWEVDGDAADEKGGEESWREGETFGEDDIPF